MGFCCIVCADRHRGGNAALEFHFHGFSRGDGMKKLRLVLPLLASLAMLAVSDSSWAKGSHGGRVYYGGGKHSSSHGGHYAGGSGSSHRGGKYGNSSSGNRYGRH